MRKHRLIELVLVVAIFSISFWNIKQQQETLSLRAAVAALDEDKKELQMKAEELINENDQLIKQEAAFSKSLKDFQNQNNNSGVDTGINIEFIKIVSKLFEANLNFTPENYEDRKREVSGYLSDELKKEYFGQRRNTYQDANGTTSQLIALETYQKGVQNNNLEGLVTVNYKSKKDGQEWVKRMNIFQVTYNDEIKKIVKIKNLGGIYSNEVID